MLVIPWEMRVRVCACVCVHFTGYYFQFVFICAIRDNVRDLCPLCWHDLSCLMWFAHSCIGRPCWTSRHNNSNIANEVEFVLPSPSFTNPSATHCEWRCSCPRWGGFFVIQTYTHVCWLMCECCICIASGCTLQMVHRYKACMSVLAFSWSLLRLRL